MNRPAPVPGTSSTSRDTIFLLGIMGRSGTNFLYDLLLKHPHTAGSRLGEDYFVANAHILDQYTRETAGFWPRHLTSTQKNSIRRKINVALGDGIVNCFHPGDEDTVLIMKTPNTRNLNLLFEFFPQSKLILLVRDGRSVVESGVRSKYWEYKQGMKNWNKSAKRILEFIDSGDGPSGRVRLIKYEELYQDTRTELSTVLDFCSLSVDEYDFDLVKDVPIIGSSEFKDEQGRYKYQRKKPLEVDNFHPLNRYSSWDNKLKDQFLRICGESMKKLGYEVDGK